jgi:hypothetical protein
MAHRELKKDEREAARADENQVTEKDRKKPYTAENTDAALDTVAPLVGDADLSANSVDIQPPAPGTNNLIQGNYFGTSASDAKLGNWIGAWFLGDLTQSTFGTCAGPPAASPSCGGSSLTQGANTVAHNRVAGVWVGPPVSGSSQIDMRGNSIYDNHTFTGPSRGLQGLGVDLLPPAVIDSGNFAVAFGISPNDIGDGDTGGNGRQNYPVISSATAAGNNLTLEGTLSSTPNTTYSIELYASAACGKAGETEGGKVVRYGEGETLLERYEVTTDGSGVASINKTATLPAGKRRVTTTATGPGATSEFSACKNVP